MTLWQSFLLVVEIVLAHVLVLFTSRTLETA